MEFSATGSEAIPFILISIAIPIIIFALVPIMIIRSVIKNVKSKLPAGVDLNQLRQVARQFPKGVNWDLLKKEWDMKLDRETGKFVIKKKTAVGKEGDSTLKPTEIQVTQLSQLPTALRKLVNATGGDKPSSEAIQFTPAGTPRSASSTISTPKTTGPKQTHSPKSYELVQKIKRIAIIIFLIGLFYGLGSFFG